MKESLAHEDIERFRKSEAERTEDVALRHSVTSNGIAKSATDLSKARLLDNVFSIDVDCGGVTNQKKSGRCWMFAGLNMLRRVVMDRLHVKDFRFSQAYLQFYDKLEKCNFVLEKTMEYAGESLYSPHNVFLHDSGVGDGGHFAMFTSLVKKYGVVPASAMPDTTVSADTGELNSLLEKVLSKDILILRRTVAAEGVDSARTEKQGMLEEIYRILSIALGEVPQSFTYEYRDKDDKFHRIHSTPLDFYRDYVGVDLDDFLALSDAPILGWKEGVKYASPLVANVVGGDRVVFFNVPTDVLKRSAIASLRDNMPLWFAADVSAQSLRKEGYLAEDILDVESLFGIALNKDKGERLSARATFCNHAMCLTGVNLDDEGRPDRWKVENSWGKENGLDGFYVMSDDWFTANVFQVVVRRKYVDEAIVRRYEAAPIEEVDPITTIF